MTSRPFPPAGVLIALLFLAVPSGASFAATAECSARTETTVPADRLKALAKGFNLNGWLDGDSGTAPDFATLAKLRVRGLTHIRLPVEPGRLMEPFSTPSEIEESFAELDGALDQLQSLGFAVSIDLHPGARLNRVFGAAPEAGLQLVKGLWRTMARRYHHRSPETLYFEVLNEPGIEEELWARLSPDIVQAIRQEAPHHTIIYALTRFQRLDEMIYRQPLPDKNIVYAAHFYDPMIFTHQGANWDDGPLRYIRGLPFPVRAADPRVKALQKELQGGGHKQALQSLSDELAEPWDKARVGVVMDEAATWAKKHDVPIVINEFGTLAWVAPRQDRLNWYGMVTGLAEAHCFGWTIWDYAQGFGFVLREDGVETPDEDMLQTLLGKKSSPLKQDL